MKKLSKFVSLMLSLALCLGMVSPALAASFDDLNEAISSELGGEVNASGTENGTQYQEGSWGFGWNSEANQWGVHASQGEDGSRNVQLNENVKYDSENDTSSTITVGEDQTVNLDLNDKNITGDGENDVIDVENGGSLTVTGGESTDEGTNTISGGANGIDVSGDLTLDGVTVSGNETGVNVNEDGSADIQNSTITNNSIGLFFAPESTVTFTGNQNVVTNNTNKNISGDGKVNFKLGEATYQVDADAAETLLAGKDSVAAHGTTKNGSSWILVKNGTVLYTGTGNNNKQLTSTIVNEVLKAAAGADGERVVTGFVIPEGVTSIGRSAFMDKATLKSISIPESVTSIETYAFWNCKSLESITIPENVTSCSSQLFGGCTALNHVELLGSFAIGSNMFNSLSGSYNSLEYVKIGENVTGIGAYAFYKCANLKTLVLPETAGFTEIGRQAFELCSSLEGNITIPSGVKTIGRGAFGSCSSISGITIPNTVTTIDAHAFKNCSGLTEIKIPSSVTTLGDEVFYCCSGLTELVIPETVTSCGKLALHACTALEHVELLGTVVVPSMSNCKKLEYVKIGENVTAISDSAFYHCTSLKTLELPEKAVFTTIGKNAFNGCTGLEGSITIPEGVVTIGASAFAGCNGISAVTIPDTVVTIDNHAFESCGTLTSINIPGSVTTIGKSAFANCSGITEVSIPEGVTTIGESAFSGCTSLTKATVPTSVTAVGKYVFYNTSVKSIWVYAEGDKDGSATVEALTSVASNLNIFAVKDEGTTLYRYGNVVTFGGNDQKPDVNEDGSVNVPAGKMAIISNNGKTTTSVEFPNAATVVVGGDGKLTIPCQGGDLAVTVSDVTWTVNGEGEITIITVSWNPTFYTTPTISGSGTIAAPDGSFSATVSNGATIGGDGTINAKTGEVTFTDKDNNTVVITGSGVKVEPTGTVFIPWSGSVKDDNGVTTYPDSATMKDGQIISKGAVTFENESGSMVSINPAEEGDPVTVDPITGVITVPTGGSTTMNDGANTLSYPDGAAVDRQGSVASSGNVEYVYALSSGTVTPPADSNITIGSDGTITVPAGSTIGEDEYPYGATILPDGTIVANRAPYIPLPDPFPVDDSIAGTAGTTIADQEVPLAGLMPVAQLLDELRQYAEIEDAELPEDFKWLDHEYAQAIYWGLQEGLVADTEEESFDPDEVVTVALLRDVLTNFAELYKGLEDFVFTLEGEDDELVMDLGERLAVFYGELEAYLKAQEAKAA